MDGCSSSVEDGKLLVTGGTNGSARLNSSEMLTEEGWKNTIPTLPVKIEAHYGWRTGPELPYGISFSQMVEDQNGGVVLIGGYSPSAGNLDTLY
jgi:hypothetical protein